MIRITDQITIDEKEILFKFTRASGPGGQKVNKTETAVQLRFDIINSTSLTREVKDLLLQQNDKRITEQGILLIDSHSYRTQEQNRKAALDRFFEFIKNASKEPEIRIETKPSRQAARKRLDEKKKKSEKKRLRRKVNFED